MKIMIKMKKKILNKKKKINNNKKLILQMILKIINIKYF